MPRKRKQLPVEQPSNEEYHDMIFSFKGCVVDVEFQDATYDKKEQNEIKIIIKSLSNEFSIDKSYVDFKGSKYEKTFMLEQGWIELCKLADKTNLTSRCTSDDQAQFVICYEMMILCYLYQCLDDLGYNLDAFKLILKGKTRFYTKVELDTIQEWKNYPGKWQTWDPSLFTHSDD